MAKKKGQEEFEVLEQASIDDDVYDRQKRIKGWDQKMKAYPKKRILSCCFL